MPVPHPYPYPYPWPRCRFTGRAGRGAADPGAQETFSETGKRKHSRGQASRRGGLIRVGAAECFRVGSADSAASAPRFPIGNAPGLSTGRGRSPRDRARDRAGAAPQQVSVPARHLIGGDDHGGPGLRGRAAVLGVAEPAGADEDREQYGGGKFEGEPAGGEDHFADLADGAAGSRLDGRALVSQRAVGRTAVPALPGQPNASVAEYVPHPQHAETRACAQRRTTGQRDVRSTLVLLAKVCTRSHGIRGTITGHTGTTRHSAAGRARRAG